MKFEIVWEDGPTVNKIEPIGDGEKEYQRCRSLYSDVEWKSEKEFLEQNLVGSPILYMEVK